MIIEKNFFKNLNWGSRFTFSLWGLETFKLAAFDQLFLFLCVFALIEQSSEMVIGR